MLHALVSGEGLGAVRCVPTFRRFADLSPHSHARLDAAEDQPVAIDVVSSLCAEMKVRATARGLDGWTIATVDEDGRVRPAKVPR